MKCHGVQDGGAEFVPGVINCIVPAVVLRTGILTRTTQQIFSSRIQGRYLKQIVVSPAEEN